MPSTCTVNVVRQFFADGSLPPPGTVCQTDYPPFHEVDLMSLSTHEAAELREHVLLGELFHRAREGLPL